MTDTLPAETDTRESAQQDDAPALDRVTEISARATGPGATSPIATFGQLVGKPRRSITFPVTISDENDDERTVTMKYRALSAKEYDEIVSGHPPSTKDRQAGAVFNLDTFAPALISAVSQEPKLSYEQAHEIWNSADWSNGELTSLFVNAQRVCNAGIDVPFNERG